MRDVNRIQPFCDELAKLWAKYPDMRFGQFILNVFGEIVSKGVDPFFPEDADMLDKIKNIEWLKDN